MKVQAQQGDTVDLLCYRHYRRTQESSHRYLMPIRGCVWQPFYARQWVEMPDITEPKQKDTVQLWD